jgi:hypothetical protein
MNDEILALIRKCIFDWRRDTSHSYENKQCIPRRNPSMPNELLLYFSNSIHSFYCGTELIPITLISRPFFTATLSPNPISNVNPGADVNRLKEFLAKFDEQFYELVQRKLDECGDKLMSSDPIWF